MKLKKIIILLVLVIIVLVVVAGYIYWPYWWLSKEERFLYSGYCPEIGRALTDQEKCDIAVLAVIKDRDSHISRFDYTTNEAGEEIRTRILIKQYDYSGLEEFYAMNPNPCKFSQKIDVPDAPPITIPLKEKISGRLNTVVKVWYIFAFDELNDNEPIYGGSTFGLSNCGKLWTRSNLSRLYRP